MGDKVHLFRHYENEIAYFKSSYLIPELYFRFGEYYNLISVEGSHLNVFWHTIVENQSTFLASQDALEVMLFTY